MKKTIGLLASLIVLTASCKKNETLKATDITENPNETLLEKLINGNQRFVDEKTIHPHQDKKTVLANQNSQHPFAIILTCSDSRVSPEILFDQGLGDLFVIRNAGNLISDIDMGSIEYAVEHLDTKLIVVLGHRECGAITAFVNDKDKMYKKHLTHIDDIVETIANEQEEKNISKESNLDACIKANIVHSTKMIQNNTIVKERKPVVVSMVYDVHTGKVNVL